MKKRGSSSELEYPISDKVIADSSMVRPRSGPTLKKLMILTVVLVATVLVYRKMSSTPLDLLSTKSSNRIHEMGSILTIVEEITPILPESFDIHSQRVYYEQMYSEVSNEVADWRQRYDSEFSRAEENLKALKQVQNQAKQLQEENETLKGEISGLKQQINGLQDISRKLDV